MSECLCGHPEAVHEDKRSYAGPCQHEDCPCTLFAEPTEAGSVFGFDNPPMLGEGVHGYAIEREGGELWIPMIAALDEGSGEVGAFLDSLRKDRRVVFASVISKRLRGMLERRGFEAGTATIDVGDGNSDVVDVMARNPV